MRIRLYCDEDSARHSLARELRFRGADVVTAIETAMAHKTDEDQLDWNGPQRILEWCIPLIGVTFMACTQSG